MKVKNIILFGLLLSSSNLISQNSITLQPSDGKDAVLWDKFPSNNYSTGQSLTILTWTNGGALTNKRIILEFDYSSLPGGATVDSATLNLYYDPTNSAESVDYHEGTNEMYVQRVTSSWDESTVTWSNQPTTTTANQLTTSATTSGTQNFELDVTDLVNDMILNGNNGFLIKMVDELNPYSIVLLSSSDHPTSSYHPKLTLFYSFASTEEQKTNQLISIYPNPSSGIFNINLDNNLPIVNAQLFDLSGRECFSFSRNNNEVFIQSAGNYLLRVEDAEGNVYNKKIIVE